MVSAVVSAPALAHAEPGLAVARSRPVPLAATATSERIEQETFSLRGIPLRRAWRTAKVDAGGSRRIVAGVVPTTAPQVDPDDAAVGPSALPELVRAALQLPAVPTFERAPQLVYLVVLGSPVLAWEVQLALTMTPEPSRKTVWISAMTGRFLDEVEQVRSARARVFLENPSKTPDPIEVELVTLADAQPGDPLQSDRLASWNCSAVEPDTLPWNVDEDGCFPVQRTLADANGDYFVPLPDVIDEQSGANPDDRYSELSMYFHAERFLLGLADRGVYEFACEQATLQANRRKLPPSEGLSFTPLNNAYFTGQCDPSQGPTMIFGQGSDVDFGYDGDVVYHELGHGVVAMLAPEGLAGARERSDATVVDSGSINEGLADYFAFMLTDDPRLAEYVGRFWPANSGAEIRTGENQRRCPDDVVGEVHADGEPVQAALWATRSRLPPAEALVLDKIVLSALTRLAADATFEETSSAFLAEAEEFRATGELSGFGYDLLDRSLRVRGLVDCPRIIDDPDAVKAGRSMYLRRTTNTVHPYYPGPMQLRYEVPEGVDAVDIAFGLRNRPDDGTAAVVLVKWGDTPIEFAYELAALDDPGDATGEAGRIREVTLVSGDFDLELTPEEIEKDEFRAPLRNLSPGRVFHVALATRATTEVVASNVRIVGDPYVPDADETGGSTGEEVEPADTDARVHGEGAVAGGCGCGTGRAPAPAWFAIVLAAACRRRRERA